MTTATTATTATTYRTTDVLFEGARAVVFRGHRADGQPVLIKQLRGLYPEPADVAWSRREYDILRAVADPAPAGGVPEPGRGPGVLRALDFTVQDGRVWLVLDAFDGARLADAFATQPPPISTALEIALGVAHALEHVHARGVVHKSLSPASVLWHAGSAEVRLIDLGEASTVSTPTRNVPSAGADLRYIAPEQTGRIVRSPDHRSDYYSLGCILCWLLTGRPPFAGDDALDLVHAHIARQPIPPATIDARVPGSLSQLVMVLLAKRAEDRYQSAKGLIGDLEAIRSETDRGAVTFVPRASDVERGFQITERIYGRAPEVTLLHAACERAAAGARELLLVTGHPGIGKTTLVHEVLEPAARLHANVITGKFDQFHRDVPYASLVQAFRQLLLDLLVGSADALEQWRGRLQAAVGDSGRALTELIAELELVIGPQPPLEQVPPEDARRRLDLVFRRFARSLASAAHPLVLFLDDLQWADLASLRMVEALVLDPDVTHLLVIGGYRDTDVGQSHPLSRTVGSIRQEGARVGLVQLGPLGAADITTLVADALHTAPAVVAPLARVCEAKTGGNPFYLRQFLTGLHADGLVRFEDGAWRWNLEAIERQSVTENVVAFMSRQIHRLPDDALRALRLAACMGTTFDLHTLASLVGLPCRATQIALAPVLARGLVQPLDDQYWVGTDDASTPDFLFVFAHDRIQEAAYEGLTAEAKRAAHLAIGRSLLRTSSDRQRARILFDIVGHLNEGVPLITDPSERLHLAELNLAAGRKALSSAAYATAHRCLQAGVGLLAEDAWQKTYPLALDLHLVAAQAAYLAAENAEMDRLVLQVTARAVDPIDRLRAQEILVFGLIARNDLLGAVQKALALLTELGFSLPRAPLDTDVAAELGPLLARLQGITPEAIAALPELDDARVSAARKLMTGVASAAYLTVPSLLPLLAFKIVHSTLDHGVSRDSAYGFALLALVLAAVKMVDLAHAYGQLAMRLLSRWDERAIRVRPTHVFNNMVRFWVEPVSATLPDLLRNYADGIDTGDIEYGLWTAHCYCYHLYYAGVPLHRVQADIAGMTQAMRHHKQLAPLAVTVPFAQLVDNLRGECATPERLAGPHVDEDAMMPVHLASNYRGAVFVLSTCMVMARVYFREYDEAATIARRYAEYRDGATATMHVASLELYETIAQLAGATPDVARAEASRDALALWAGFNPVTFGHWRMVVDAELARVRGDVAAALDGYDAAIAHAARHGLVGDEALINERAALFHLGRGSHRVARAYLLEARQAYERWGATAKVAHLERLHPASLVGTASPHAAAGAGATDIDLEALFRASFVLSEEIRLDRLLRKVVGVSIQNAAATRGCLVVERDGRLVVEVGLDADGADVGAPHAPLTGNAELAATVVQYVARTAENLVLTDASSDRRFSIDPYLKRSGPTAILCVALVHKGRRQGILYLENHLVTGCFTPARLKTIQVLAAQAAISIENAGLVDNLESRVAERTEALEGALEQTRQKHQQLVASQQRLLIADRLAVLGQLVAGVAHELNSPLGAIGASSDNLAASTESMLRTLWLVARTATPAEQESLTALLSATEEVPLSSRERRVAHRSLAASLEGQGVDDASRIADTLVSMGVASLSDDVRATLASPARAQLLGAAADIASLRTGIRNIQEGARRMSRIVFALKSYANPGGREVFYEGSLAANLDNTLTLYGHQLRTGFEVVRDYAGDTVVEAMHDRLNQVWTNLVHNALLAMGTSGTLTVRIGPSGADHVIVTIGDTGVGVPDEVRGRIFEAFFTTRAVGEGSGLGLAICRDIVSAHGGTIGFESKPGDTTFVVRLPRAASVAGRA